MRNPFTPTVTPVLLLVTSIAVLAVACGDDDDVGAAPTAAPTETATEAASPTATSPTASPTQTPAPTATDVPPSDYPLTVTDHYGTEVTIESEPATVVALLNSVTNLVVDLGHSAVVAGTDEFTIAEHPDAFTGAANVGGSLFQFDLEAITALEPDLVIMGDLGQSDELSGQLRTLGIKVVILGFPATPDAMLDQMVTVGTLLGDAQGAQAVMSDLRDRLDAVAAAVADGDPITVYMESDQSDPAAPYAVGPGGLYHAALLLAGGENILADAATSFPKVNHETIVDRNPQVVILLDSEELSDETFFAPISVSDAKARIGWDAISAVQNDNVYPFDPSDLSTGKALIEGIEKLAEILAEARTKVSYLPGAITNTAA